MGRIALYHHEHTQDLAHGFDQIVAGKADLTDVVTAVSEAETALNTVVAIRDRVISAYQDIIKMPI